MWILREGYLELSAPQRSEVWKRARKVTASNIEAILGLSPFKTKQEIISQILDGPEKAFSVEEQARMDKGIQMEAPMRAFHLARFCPGATVVEPSLCVGLRWYDVPFKDGKLSDYYPSQLGNPLHPNWLIGGSPDGIITFPDGKVRNLELKFTQKGYQPLNDRLKSTENSHRYTPCSSRLYQDDLKKIGLNLETGALDYFPHIWRSHYLQMQTCMSITRNLECDYGVGTPTSYYTETIPYDEKYWVAIYEDLIRIIETEIKPRMSLKFLDEINEAIRITPPEMELKIPV